MGGLAGVVRFDGGAVEPGWLEGMTAAIGHRGSGGIHHVVKGPVGLAQSADLPVMSDDESLFLVMDGRVENRAELRELLVRKVAVVRIGSDQELVLKAYEVFGHECTEHIDGDFVFVVWDARRKEAFCARDRMGHKPFCFWRTDAMLAFASEPSAILSLPFVDAQINLGVVAEFLAQEFLTHTETMWNGVERLPQATWMRVGQASVVSECYWDPGSGAELVYPNDHDYIEHYRDLFFDQIQRSARSTHPVAVEVSGGLDSSAVFAGCVHLQREGLLPAPGLAGFTFHMPHAPEFDDTKYVEAVESFLRADVARVEPRVDTPGGYRSRAAVTGSFPGYPNGVMHMSIHEKAREAGCTALLTGVGGDEWLGGTRSSLLGGTVSGRIGAAIGSLCRNVRAVLGESSRSDRGRLALSRELAELHETRKREARESTDFSGSDSSDRARMLRYYRDPFRVIAAEQSELLGALSGVEVRHPLDSARILEFALACPARLRRYRQLDRPVHREAMAGLLPPEVLGRTSKASFDWVFRKSFELLESERPPADLAGRWLDDRHSDLATRWVRAGESGDLTWMDWSLWSLFGCWAVSEGFVNPRHGRGRS